MHKSANWDDLRFVLAVAESGSVNAASQILGVNHATVLRRISAFEERYEITVFDRISKGYRPSQGAARLIEAAREVERAHQAMERVVSGVDTSLKGIVRLTSTDSLSTALLPGMVEQFRRVHNRITIELQTSNAHVSLSRLEADLTIRPAKSLSGDLIGRHAADMGFAVYGRRDVVDLARTAPDLVPWLTVSDMLSGAVPGQWCLANVPKDQITGRADSFVTLTRFAAEGLGLALLPCLLGGRENRLVRRDPGPPVATTPVWVATHADLSEVPRIRATQEFLVAALAEAGDELSGH